MVRCDPAAAPSEAGLAANTPLQTRVQYDDENNIFAERANRIAIHHPLGAVVAVIEIVLPGSKSSAHAISSFVAKMRRVLNQGVHLLLIDPFPRGSHDPQGIHKAIWDGFEDEVLELPSDKPITLAAYVGGPLKRAYVEPIAIGDPLPYMPVFLANEQYIPAPLESTYQTTWSTTPEPVKELLR
jgi:hypothetical protein